MGNPTGFMNVPRALPEDRDPTERLIDWLEVHEHMDTPAIEKQASRCMDCGVPFCQSDTGCPVDNLIPEWNDLVYQGRWREALDRLHKTNNFPDLRDGFIGAF